MRPRRALPQCPGYLAPDLRRMSLVKRPIQTPASGAVGLQPVRVMPSFRETALDELRTQVQALLGTSAK